MKFVCDRCQTKYSIADERVRGKVLKVKCKTCANLITVREARRPSSAGFPTLSAAGHARAGVHPPIDTSVETEERTQLAQSPFGPETDAFPDLGALAPAPPSVPARRPTGQMPPVGGVDDHVQWYLALDGNRTGPFNRQKLVDRLIPLAKNADVHIWNERLDGWKSPSGVPEIAAEISRRRASAPPPPPLPGAPRRPTPPPVPPIGGQPHGQPRRPTGPVAPVGHGAGAKLPPPGGVHPALAARGAAETGAADPSSLLETPAPLPHGLPHTPKTNGVGASGAHATHPPPRPATSDIMQTLNLPGSSQQVPGAPPRLMSLTSTIALGGTVAPATRSRSATIILALLLVIAIVVVLVVVNLKRTTRAPAVAVAPPAPALVVEKPPEPPPPPPPVIEPTQPPPPPVTGKGKPRGGKPTRAAGKQPPAATALSASDAARFRDNSRPNVPVATSGGGGVRGQPAQADITKVITNNRGGIKVCYQRALTRDNSLTHGKLAVKLSIGISGRVKRVGLDGPTQFRTLLEPCIKEVVQRWVFPQASDEYETEFPLVFQGNE